MKYRILPTLLFCFLSLSLFAQDQEMEQMMTRRVMNYDDAGYNIVLLIPKLYKEKKEETIDSLISYYHRNFGTSPEIVLYSIVSEINKGTFKESIKYYSTSFKDTLLKLSDTAYYQGSILSYYIPWYKDRFNIANDDNYSPYIRKAYGDYIDFLATLSKDLLKRQSLTPAERWLLSYLAHPNDDLFKQLENIEFNGSVLQKTWVTYQNKYSGVDGGGFSLLVGNWVPDGKLSILGNHPFIGFTMGGKVDEHFLMDVRMDFRFLQAANYYQVPVSNIVFTTNHFFGMNVGLDMGYEIFRRKKHELDFLGGIAWEYFETISGSDIDANNFSNSAGEYNSLNLSTGLVYRLYVHRKLFKDKERFSYFALQCRYNFLFFHNKGGSDFNGDAWTIGLSFGGFTRKAKQYTFLYE